jgi:hypothetical protein
VELGWSVAEPDAAAHATRGQLEASQCLDGQQIGLDEIVDVAEGKLGRGGREQGAKPGAETVHVHRA